MIDDIPLRNAGTGGMVGDPINSKKRAISFPKPISASTEKINLKGTL